MATLNFNAHEVDPSTPFEALPPNKYLAMIVASELKPTAKGDGHYLVLEFEVLDGKFKGRKVWTRLNLQNPNADTVKIARGELSALCRAVGVMQPKDSIELHNLPLVINVKCKKREDTGDITNEIKGFEAKNAAAAANAPQTAPAAGAAPWKR